MPTIISEFPALQADADKVRAFFGGSMHGITCNAFNDHYTDKQGLIIRVTLPNDIPGNLDKVRASPVSEAMNATVKGWMQKHLHELIQDIGVAMESTVLQAAKECASEAITILAISNQLPPAASAL